MCGICGVIYTNQNKIVDKDLLEFMNDTLSHRGPDDEGYFIEENVGLAMKRLSIIELREKMGKKGRKIVEEKFSLRRMITKYERSYNGLIDRF